MRRGVHPDRQDFPRARDGAPQRPKASGNRHRGGDLQVPRGPWTSRWLCVRFAPRHLEHVLTALSFNCRPAVREGLPHLVRGSRPQADVRGPLDQRPSRGSLPSIAYSFTRKRQDLYHTPSLHSPPLVYRSAPMCIDFPARLPTRCVGTRLFLSSGDGHISYIDSTTSSVWLQPCVHLNRRRVLGLSRLGWLARAPTCLHQRANAYTTLASSCQSIARRQSEWLGTSAGRRREGHACARRARNISDFVSGETRKRRRPSAATLF